MSDRPNCLNRDACIAKTRKHCRSCTAKAAAKAPGAAEKRSAATRARFQDPKFRAKHSRAMSRARQRLLQDPEQMEKQRESGRRLVREVLTRPEIRARTYSAETNAKRAAAYSEHCLGWCPPEYRDAYRELATMKGGTAAKAKQEILDQIAADERKLRQAPRIQRQGAIR